MENKIKFTLEEAKNIIIKKLIEGGIFCEVRTGYKEDIGSDNFMLDINYYGYSYGYSSEPRNYDKINISIRTVEYPNTRRALKNFDVVSGNYNKLIEKVKEIIGEDIKKKDNEKIKEQKEKNNQQILNEKIKLDLGLKGIKEDYSGRYTVKNKYFKVKFYATTEGIYAGIQEDSLTVDSAIDLLKKLKEKDYE